MMDDRQRHEENENRKSADTDENHIDGAMHALPRTAMPTAGQMLFVIDAHFGRNSRDVISPARKYVPDDSIGA
jgi:hypothetical protein